MLMDIDYKEGLGAIAAIFSVCSFSIGTSFYIGGFAILDESNLSISRALMNLLRSFLYTSLTYSLYYAFAHRLHALKIPEFPTPVTPSLHSLLSNLKCFLTSQVAFFVLCLHANMIYPFILMKIGIESTFSALLVLATLFLRNTYWAKYRVFFEEWVKNSSSLGARLWRRRKIVEFGAGMLGSIMFQNFIKLTSIEQVKAFLCFSIGWVCSIVVIDPPTDGGILAFLLSNVSLGCTVNIYGVKGPTWIVYAICVLVFWLHSKLKIISMAYTKFMEE